MKQAAKVKTCRKGLHTYTGKQCMECVKVTAAARYAANPHKRKAYQLAYLSNPINKSKVKAAIKAWRLRNLDREKITGAAWYAANTERRLASSKVWRAKNLDKHKALVSAWNAAHPGMMKIYSQTRRAREFGNGDKLSLGLTEKLLKLQRGKCACCKKPLGKSYHMDHITPLSKGGTNTDNNIQLLTARCNRQKSAKHPIDFMRSRGFLI